MSAQPRNHESASPGDEAAKPSPYGLATAVVGMLVVLAGPVVLLIAMLPHLVPTIGPQPLTYWKPDLSVRTGAGDTTALYFGALLLPAAGFSMAYLAGSHRLRRRFAGFCTVFFPLQAVLLAVALFWITGTGLHASDLFGADRENSTSILTAPIAMLFCAAAAAIMYVLARRTDFDAKSADYFGQGDTVVRVTPLPVLVHALWVLLGLAACAAVVYLPVVALWRVDGLEVDWSALPGTLQAWPRTVDYDFATARAAYAVVLGILVGAVASSLLKKGLYLTVLSSRMLQPVDSVTEHRWRTIQSFTHYPIALAGGALTACVLFLVPVGRYPGDPDITAIAIFGAIGTGLLLTGVYFNASAWKSGDHPLNEAALQQAVVGDLQKTFAVPERRKRSPTRPEGKRGHPPVG